jgi:two-component system KDP operon response regulator KdpE
VDGIALDVEGHAILDRGTALHLTRLETKVLQILMAAAGRTVNADRLVSEAWGRAGPEERHALKQVIYRLRRKLDSNAATQGRLQTTRSAGYRWATGGHPYGGFPLAPEAVQSA